MVDIMPLNGLIYNRDKITKYSEVLSPPYDVISEQLKEYLKKINPYNIVKLTLPDETSSADRYENSRITLAEWIRKNILRFDLKKCFYLLEETFTENGTSRNFKGFIGLLKVEEYGEGKVLRHEKTLSEPKEDRFALLKACRTNFEFIYTIYNDDDRRVSAVLNKPLQDECDISTSVDYDPSLYFRLWKLSDEYMVDTIKKLMKPKTLLIADGHHRYETSRLYKEYMHMENTGNPEEYVLTLFVSANQKDIMIHPTHRIIKFDDAVKPEEIIKRIEKYFTVLKIKPDSKHISDKMQESFLKKKKSLCVFFKNQDCYFITLNTDLRKLYAELNIEEDNFNTEYEYLDVNVLHKLIIDTLLADFNVSGLNFVHSIDEVIESVGRSDDSIDFDTGFILNPPTIETVEKLSYEGRIMPQKSTYFYPKPCSGLVIYKFDR